MPFASSACDNRDRQALSDDVVELTRRDVIVPLQAMVTLPSYPRFGECNVIAICDAPSNLNGKRATRPATSVMIFISGMPIAFCCRRKTPEVVYLEAEFNFA
jgi:hypothetical protein